MANIDTITREMTTRGKSVLEAVADIVEDVTRKNLEVANDVAGFAISQIRMPAKVKNFSDYRERQQSAYSNIRGTLRTHGQEYISALRDIPQQLRDSWTVELKPVAPKAKAAKKPAARKASTRKAPVRKTARKTAARKTTAKRTTKS